MKHRSIFLIILLVMAVLVTAGCSSRSMGPVQSVPSGDRDLAERMALESPQVTTGAAVTPGANCRKGLSTCDGYCRDLSVDVSNCGYCGNACPNGWGNICREGMCTCKEGLSNCDGLCWDLINDNRNCGECGNICPTGKVCNSGTCSICSRGLVECSPGQCAYLEADAKNCGVCGNICPAGQRCIKGQCGGSVCSAPRGYCGGNCYDLSSDGINCGSCGNICASGMICRNGLCSGATGSIPAAPPVAPPAQQGGGSCPSSQIICGGTCKEIWSDNKNCGTCGTLCTCPPQGADPATTCTSAQCVFGKCMVMCQTIKGPGSFSVNSAYPATDPRNCGACGKVCASGTCVNGVCG